MEDPKIFVHCYGMTEAILSTNRFKKKIQRFFLHCIQNIEHSVNFFWWLLHQKKRNLDYKTHSFLQNNTFVNIQGIKFVNLQIVTNCVSKVKIEYKN